MEHRDGDNPRPAQPAMRLAALAIAAGLAGTLPSTAHAEAPDLARTRIPEAERMIETLSARLLASHSATAVLEAWCAERGLSADPRLVALRVTGPDKPPSPAQRERLAIGPEEPVRYRRVRLACADRVLSEADNWYVPSRLTPEMNALLDETQLPFGRVVHPLSPMRRQLSIRKLWRADSGQLPGASEPLFHVEALLTTGDGTPFSEVAETYTGAVLARESR